MHTSTFDAAITGRHATALRSSPARKGPLHRLLSHIRARGTIYELDAHLARDIGVDHYTVPMISREAREGWR